MVHAACHRLARCYFRLYHRMIVEGAGHFPSEPPFVLIANHASHLDALALAAALLSRVCHRVFPIAAGDVFFETPVRSVASALFLNALPMWRRACGSHALVDLRARLVDEPCAYILFPEGGRSLDGRIMPFKAGLGALVAGTAVPVILCHLAATFEAFPPGARLPRPRQVRVAVGAGLRFDEVANTREGWHEVAAIAEAAVRRLAERPSILAEQNRIGL
jgi:1-acyl-sn-glycerol-3-phosphate acyltransferase